MIRGERLGRLVINGKSIFRVMKKIRMMMEKIRKMRGMRMTGRMMGEIGKWEERE